MPNTPPDPARPDLSDRPIVFTVELSMRARPEAIYQAWTEQFDTWFAHPGAIRMQPVVDEPFLVETHDQGGRHPHYGRFLALEPDRLIKLTSVTETPGTIGAETVVRVELTPNGDGTELRLTHSGFYDEAGIHEHQEPWKDLLARPDEQLIKGRKRGPELTLMGQRQGVARGWNERFSSIATTCWSSPGGLAFFGSEAVLRVPQRSDPIDRACRFRSASDNYLLLIGADPRGTNSE